MSLIDSPFKLDTPSKLFDVLIEFSSNLENPWRGSVSVTKHAPTEEIPEPPEQWILDMVSLNGKGHVSASMGQWMVLSYGQILVLDSIPE